VIPSGREDPKPEPASRASISVWNRIRLQPEVTPSQEPDDPGVIAFQGTKENNLFRTRCVLSIDGRGPDKDWKNFI
jgi:hypothetical protein